MDKTEIKRRIDAGNFSENNGRVLRTINILVGKDIKISSLRYALPDVDAAEFGESLFYLQDAGYIKARNVYSKSEADVADCEYEDAEVRLTAKGMQLLKGFETNPAVKV